MPGFMWLQAPMSAAGIVGGMLQERLTGMCAGARPVCSIEVKLGTGWKLPWVKDPSGGGVASCSVLTASLGWCRELVMQAGMCSGLGLGTQVAVVGAGGMLGSCREKSMLAACQVQEVSGLAC